MISLLNHVVFSFKVYFSFSFCSGFNLEAIVVKTDKISGLKQLFTPYFFLIGKKKPNIFWGGCWQLTLVSINDQLAISLKPPPPSLLTAYQNFFSKSNFFPTLTAYPCPPPSFQSSNLKVPIKIVSQDLSFLHELFYYNKVTNFIEFA